MKFNWRYELPQLLLIAAMFTAAAWAWPQLPERLPIHWNIRGEVDGWGNKFMGLLFLPLMVLGLYFLLLLLPLIDPGKSNYASFQKVYGIIRIAFVTFMAALYTATLFAAFGRTINMTTIIMPLVGFLFIVLGNFLGKIRPNWFVGIRTPWTLSSQLSWDKTHRLAGWLFIFMGLLCFLIAFFQNIWMLVAVLVIDGLCAIWMVIYSYLVYRNDPHRTPPAGTSPSKE
jgi:immunity protein, SdpI family